MNLFQGNTATELWDKVFEHMSSRINAQESTVIPSRVGDVIDEALNAVLVLTDPTRGIIQSKIRKMPMRYALGELLWYLSGTNRTADIAQYSDFWVDLSDDGIHSNSAYGHRIKEFFGFDQWEFVKTKLKKDPHDRQAVIHIKDASDKPSKDIPCTVMLQFQIRSNKLYLTVYMRSNDVWRGLPYDMFAFTSLQVLMAMELGVGLGEYTHIAGTLHLYERDWEAYCADQTHD